MKVRFFASILALTTQLPAVDFIWDGGGGNNNWGAPDNWNPNVAPPNDGTADLIFSGSTRPMPNAQAEYTINTLRFSLNTAAFTLVGQRITLREDGGQSPFIRNDALVAQTINNDIVFSHQPSSFAATIHAQNGNLTLNGGINFGFSGFPSTRTLTFTADADRTLFIGSVADIGGENVTGSSNIAVSGDGIVRFNSTISNSGSFTIGSASTAEIAGVVPTTSSITISPVGSLHLLNHERLRNSAPFGMSPGSSFFLNDFSETIGTLSGNGGNIHLGTGGALTVNQDANTTYSGALDGSGSFVKSGGGTLVLSGPVSHTGSTTVSAGTLQINQNLSLSPNATLTVNAGATVHMPGRTAAVRSLAGGGAISLGNGSLTAGGNNANTTWSGSINGLGGTFTKAGTGIMQITAAQTHNGGTHVSAGVLFARADGALGTGGSTTIGSGGTLRLERGLTLARPNGVTLSGTGAAASGAIHLAEAGPASDSTLTGPMNLTGPATIRNDSGGRLFLGASDGSETFDMDRYPLTVHTQQSAGSVHIRHQLAGGGGLVVTGPGRLFLEGNNGSHTGPIDVQAGSLELASGQALAGGNAPVAIAAARDIILSPGIAVSTSRPLDLQTGSLLRGNNNTSWSGTGDIRLLGGHAIIQAEDSSHFTIGGSGSITGSASLTTHTLFANSTLTINRSLTITDMLGKSGPGILILNGACSYLGATVIHEGTLRLGSANRLPDATEVTIHSGAIFHLNNHDETVASISGAGTVSLGSGTLTLTPSIDATHSGNITGSGSVIVDGGSATQTFSTANTYTGPTTVRNNGKLAITAANVLSATARLTVESGGEVRIGASGQTVGSLVGNGASTITHTAPGGVLRVGGDNTTSSVWNGTIQGPGGLVKTGSGTLSLNGSQPYTGPTTVESGTLYSLGLPSSAVTITAGAALSGQGTFANIDCSGVINNTDGGDGEETISAGAVILRSGSVVGFYFDDLDAPEALHAASLQIPGGDIHIHLSTNETPDLAPGETKILKVIRTTNGITGNISGINLSGNYELESFIGTVIARVNGNDIEVVFTGGEEGGGYQSWIEGFDLDEEEYYFNADPDNDGIPNVIEYVLGGDPANADDSALLPTFSQDATHMEFVFRRTRRSVYLNPFVQHSIDLDDWHHAEDGEDGVTISFVELDEDTDEVTVRIPKNGEPKRFARLGVER